MNVLIDNNLKEQIENLTLLADRLEKIETNTQKLQFITVREFAELTGWSIATVQNLFNRKDFPSCNFGKEKIAEINAVREYFKIPRRR